MALGAKSAISTSNGKEIFKKNLKIDVGHFFLNIFNILEEKKILGVSPWSIWGGIP